MSSKTFVWSLKLTIYGIQGINFNSSFVFFSVIDMEVAKTTTSFLASQDNYWRSGFLLTDVVFDMA